MYNITLNGESYVRFPSNPKLYEKSNLFISLDVDKLDWNEVGSQQIIGNFNGQGLGLFYSKGIENVIDYSILDKGNNHLFYFNSDGGLISQRNFPSSTKTPNFTAVLVDHTNSKFYFDQANHTCYEFDINNISVNTFTINTDSDISALVSDKEGNLYFMDIFKKVIHKYSSNGVFIEDLTFSQPDHNNLVIRNNGDITTFYSREGTYMFVDSSDNYYTLWGANIYKNGQPWFFVSPQSNAINIDDEDNIWVVYNNNKIIKLNTDGLIIFDRTFHNIKPCIEFNCPPKSSKSDDVGIGFTKFGDTLQTRIILNKSGYIIDIDSDGDVIGCELVNSLLDVSSYTDVSYKKTKLLTNGDFTGFNSINKYKISNTKSSNLVVKFALSNPCNDNVSIQTLTHEVTNFKNGIHQISFGYNGERGLCELIVDGLVVSTLPFKGVLHYIEDKLPPFLIGADSGNFRAKQEELGINDTSYFKGVVSNLSISSESYNRNFSSKVLKDVVMEFPTKNPISFRERVEKFYLFRSIGSKSSQYDVVIKNSGVSDLTTRKKIENNIKGEITEVAPAHSNLQKIEWADEIRFKDLV